MQKTARKTANILKKETILKIGKNGHQEMAIALLGPKLKMQKSMLKTSLQDIAVVVCKNTARKNS